MELIFGCIKNENLLIKILLYIWKERHFCDCSFLDDLQGYPRRIGQWLGSTYFLSKSDAIIVINRLFSILYLYYTQ